MNNKIDNKKVLFITTKNLDYIRNTQEINLIKNKAKSVEVIGSNNKKYILRLLIVYFKLLVVSVKRFDTVFIGFAPQLIVPFWNWKFKHKIVIIDFFISMYDTFVCDRKKFKSRSFFAKTLHKIDKKTIDVVDYIVVDTKAHGEYFCQEFGASKEKINVWYLEADKSIYYPREQRKLEKFKDNFVVLYFGSILPLQGVDIVIKAIKLLKDKNFIHFIVIGPVSTQDKLYTGDNVEYIDWLPQKKLAEYISMADLCLAGHFNANIAKARRTIPGKAYIYNAMGKKMILGDGPANHELYKESEMVYFVEMGNEKALADKILMIAGV